MATRRRRKGKLPRYVQRAGSGFRGWFMEAGERRYTHVYPTPEEAHEEAVARRKALARPTGRLTLEQGIEMVRGDLRACGRRNGTVSWYEDQFAALRKAWHDNMRLDELTKGDVERFIRARLDGKRKVSANTVLAHLRALNRIFELGIQEELLDRNPVKGAKRPTAVEPRVHVFSWEVVQEILRSVSDQTDADLMALFVYSGIRRAEAARIRVDDLGKEGLPIVGKRGNRVLPVPEELAGLLERVKDRSTGPWLVEGATEARRCETVRRTFDRWRRRLERPGLLPHAMRHTFASELARRGVPEHVLADLLGHSRQRSVTSRYITTFGPEVTKAMQILWNGEHWG